MGLNGWGKKRVNGTFTIQYCFKFGDDVREVFNLDFDVETLELIVDIPKELPQWARLGFHQCPHCPLSALRHRYCPVAEKLVNIASRFDSLLSYNEIHLDVITDERLISQHTTVQRGLGSLMGLIMATSGCPHIVYFKPMARFHLPLASEEETIYRAASMYLLAQYFRNQAGEQVDLELEGLRKIYDNIQLVNRAFAKRLRIASKTDSLLNAIVELDVFAQTMSIVIEESLEDLKYLFQSYLGKSF
jgi:hypothetical protein